MTAIMALLTGIWVSMALRITWLAIEGSDLVSGTAECLSGLSCGPQVMVTLINRLSQLMFFVCCSRMLKYLGFAAHAQAFGFRHWLVPVAGTIAATNAGASLATLSSPLSPASRSHAEIVGDFQGELKEKLLTLPLMSWDLSHLAIDVWMLLMQGGTLLITLFTDMDTNRAHATYDAYQLQVGTMYLLLGLLYAIVAYQYRALVYGGVREVGRVVTFNWSCCRVARPAAMSEADVRDLYAAWRDDDDDKRAAAALARTPSKAAPAAASSPGYHAVGLAASPDRGASSAAIGINSTYAPAAAITHTVSTSSITPVSVRGMMPAGAAGMFGGPSPSAGAAAAAAAAATPAEATRHSSIASNGELTMPPVKPASHLTLVPIVAVRSASGVGGRPSLPGIVLSSSPAPITTAPAAAAAAAAAAPHGAPLVPHAGTPLLAAASAPPVLMETPPEAPSDDLVVKYNSNAYLAFALSCAAIASFFVIRTWLFLYRPMTHGGMFSNITYEVLYPWFFYAVPEGIPVILIVNLIFADGIFAVLPFSRVCCCRLFCCRREAA